GPHHAALRRGLHRVLGLLADALDLAQDGIERVLERPVQLVALGGPQLLEVLEDAGARLRGVSVARQVTGHLVPAQDRFSDVVHLARAPDDRPKIRAPRQPCSIRRQMASANEVVVAVPPRSGVTWPDSSTSRSDVMMRAAFSSSCRCCSISTAESSSAVGLA